MGLFWASCSLASSKFSSRQFLNLILFALIFFVIVQSTPILAQEAAQMAVLPHPLITQPVDESQLTTLKGNTHPLARAVFDLGTAPATLPMERMLLVLKRSPEQETALRKMLDDQQDKNSPSYHKWVTPEQFGKQFGPTDADMQVITGWLQSHGFQVGSTKGRTLLEFSGSASQVQEAFHTTIHKYEVNGEQHWANATDPAIPAALAPAVAGVMTLHNFHKKPQYFLSKERGTITPGKTPLVTFKDGSHGLGPGDYAVIYNINPVYHTMGIDGTGITIGVVARSQIQLSDVTDFQNLLSFSSNTPTIIVNGTDPGVVPGDDVEGTLDATWSQAIAPGATVDFVISASTDTSDGVDLSELYIIENNLANVMTESFGTCEASASDAQFAGTAGLAEQAAAQGITYMVSTGDSGAPGCDNPNLESSATGPVSVNLLASTPFTVAVGGTMFNEHGADATYWSTTNTPSGKVSVLSYIPENVWNESCASCQFPNILAGGGGVSTGNVSNGGSTAGFARPSWQAGVTGIPTNIINRDLPDVSLTASGHDAYLLCYSGAGYPCSGGSVYLISGTSASAPSFAAIMALVDQKMGQVSSTESRQGQANYVLYPLAAAGNGQLSKCNASSTTTAPLGTCTFYDVKTGNNAVPGEANYGTANAQYQATTGYDLATGLGSVNVANLITNWAATSFRATTTALTLSPLTNITHGQSVNVTVGVTASSGTGTPTGDISLIAHPSVSAQISVDGFSLDSTGHVSSTTNQLPGGSYTVTAHYAGNSTTTPTGIFGASDSNAVTVTVTSESSTTTLEGTTFDANGNFAFLTGGSIPYGDLVYLHATVAGLSGFGVPTGSVTFQDGSGGLGSYNLASDGSTATPTGLFTVPVGAHSIRAQYVGDASFKTSTSTPALVFSIDPAPTSLSVTPSSNSVASGGTVGLTANFTLGTTNLPSFGAGPTGTVSFYSNGTLLGSANVSGAAGVGNLQSGLFAAASGTASFTTTAGALPDGQDSITAIYHGDTNYAASPASTAVVISVGGTPDFILPTGGLGTVTVSRGGSGTVNLSLSAVAGFSGTVTFACAAASLPSETTCTSGTIVTPATTGTLTVKTTGPHTVALLNGRRGSYLASVTMGAGILFGGVLILALPRKRRGPLLMSLMVFTLLVGIPACGGGGGGGGSHQDPGTPLGTTTVTVNATSGSLSHTTTFVLTVQ